MRAVPHVWVLILILAGPGFVAHLWADTVILNDGTSVDGSIVEETPESVTVKVKFGQVSYKRSEIKELKKSGGGASTDAGQLRDILKLKSGEEHQGLVVSEDDKKVVFDLIVSGKNFSKTMLTQTTFPRDEIAELKQLSDTQRALARSQLASLDTQAKDDVQSEQNVKIESYEWDAKEPGKKIQCKKVELDYFTLESDTNDDFMRKAAFRLGKVYGTYKQHFGMDRNQGSKVKVIIFNSMEEYQAAIGGQIKNPAFYAPDLKLISGGCDVARYEAEIAAIREYHVKLDRQLEALKRRINDDRTNIQALVNKFRDIANQGGKGLTQEGKAMMDDINSLKIKAQLEMGELEKKARNAQDEIYGINRHNDIFFNDYTKLMFATLYHEGFHAFLDNFLFPEDQSKIVPRWLNEGLAQYFEAARIEGSRFVLGQEDRNKMALLRKFKKEGGLIPLDDIMMGGAADYMVHDITNLEHSTKNYLQAWLIVHWLGENNRLNKETLSAYVTALKEKKLPTDALPILSGVPNAQLEAALNQKLKPSFEQAEPALKK